MLACRFFIPLTYTTLASGLLLILPGCNGGSDPAPVEPAENSQSTTNTGQTGSPGTVTTDSQGNKSIDGIPYDVFFDDPLAVVAQTGTVSPTLATTGTPNETNTDPPETTDPVPEEPPATVAVKWDEMIPMEILDAEIKSIRNFLTPTLQTVGAYNREYKQIPMQGMTMAALAQIALAHPEEALWKDKAAALRDISYNLANSAESPGRASFDASTLQFENVLQIFNGSTPDLEEEPDPALAFSDKADRGPLMRRMDAAFDFLSSNTSTPSALMDVKEKAMHETVILSTLMQVSSDESYLYADEEDYQGHVTEMMAVLAQMRNAIEDNKHDSFREGVGILNKKCTECHGDYKD